MITFLFLMILGRIPKEDRWIAFQKLGSLCIAVDTLLEFFLLACVVLK